MDQEVMMPPLPPLNIAAPAMSGANGTAGSSGGSFTGGSIGAENSQALYIVAFAVVAAALIWRYR